MKTDLTEPIAFARYPAVRIVLLFCGGIILQRTVPLPVDGWLLLLTLFLLLFGMAEAGRYRGMQRTSHLFPLCCYCLLVIAAGGARYAVDLAAGTALEPAVPLIPWEQIEVEGELTRVGRSVSGRYRMELEVERTRLSDSVDWKGNWRLSVSAGADRFPARRPPALGSRLTLLATVYPLEGRRNPREFDYRRYLHQRNIFVRAGTDSLLSVLPPEKATWNLLRQKVLDRIDHNFSADTAPLAKALLLGYKDEIGRTTRRDFSRAGLSHIMAVSGLHIGFLLAPCWFFIPFLWTLRAGKWLGIFFLVLLLLFYGGLTGFPASVVRASITGGCLFYGRLFHRVRNPVNLTAVAALIILAFDPGQLFTIGFQLSFSAVFIILLSLPALHMLVPGKIRYRPGGRLLMMILISAAVQSGLFPLLAHYFGEFSVVGPLLNALALPLLTLVIPLSLLLLIVSLFHPAPGAWLNGINDHSLRLLSRSVTEAAGWEWSWISIPEVDPLLFPVWICLILLTASFRTPIRWKLVAILLLLISAASGKRLASKISPSLLTVTHFDVGQGDAALVQTPGGRHLLIDAGRWTPTHNSADHLLIPHLKAEGIDTLDAVFLTHPHADHIGGMPALLKQVGVKRIYHSGQQYDSELFHRYRRIADERDVPTVALRAGDSVPVDPAVRLLVYAPAGPPDGTDPNRHSLVLEIIYGSTEFLFMGDAGRTAERRLIGNFGSMLESDHLKAGHHGSGTAGSTSFLRTVRPGTAVISVARSNRFGHPDPDAIRRLRRQVPRLRFTSLSGALVYSSDGSGIIRERWR